MSYMRNKTSINLRLLCRNHEPCLIDVAAEHAEADVLLRHRHRQPSLRLMSTHQDVCDPYLQHTILLGIRPTALKKLDVDVGVAEQECDK
jgi:hypothetical protein